MIWPAPAKLNLFLHIVGRRADGYHLLQTVFQFLDYGDELEFRVTEDARITRSRKLPGIPAATDLTLHAAQLLQRAVGATQGVEIALCKRVPVGSGLGGGSSDAATTLLALNELWRAGLTVDALAALGLCLGADVPVFVRGHAAWAEGVGEVLTPVELPQPWYFVIVPPLAVATADVYAEFARENRLTPYTEPRTIRDLREGYGHNDLERVVRRCYPAVERAFEWMARYGQPRMTGSGGAVFLELPDREHGERMRADLPANYEGFVARGMNRHPLSRREEA